MKNVRWLLVLSCCLFAIGSLVMGIFAKSIERALVLPPDSTVVEPSATIPAGATPTQVPTPMAMVPLSTPMTTHFFAQDTFQRPDQVLWGAASDGQHWEGDANRQARSFFIAGKQGIIMHAQGILNAMLGPTSSNVEVSVSGSLSRFGGIINFGVVVRWADANNWYKAFINGTHFVMLKRVKGVTTQLSIQPFTAQGNTLYTIHFRAIGVVLFANVWPSADPEPHGWMLNVTDTSLTTGQGGMRVLLQNDIVVHLVTFSEAQTISQV